VLASVAGSLAWDVTVVTPVVGDSRAVQFRPPPIAGREVVNVPGFFTCYPLIIHTPGFFCTLVARACPAFPSFLLNRLKLTPLIG